MFLAVFIKSLKDLKFVYFFINKSTNSSNMTSLGGFTNLISCLVFVNVISIPSSLAFSIKSLCELKSVYSL